MVLICGDLILQNNCVWVAGEAAVTTTIPTQDAALIK